MAGIRNKLKNGDHSSEPRVVQELLTRDLPENVATRHVRMCRMTLTPDANDYDLTILLILSRKELNLEQSIVG